MLTKLNQIHFLRTDICAPIPEDSASAAGESRLQIYQLVTFAWSLVFPVPMSFGLYFAMGVKLYIQQRAKERRVANGGGAVATEPAVPSAYSAHSTMRASHSKSQQLSPNVTSEMTKFTQPNTAAEPTSNTMLELRPLARNNSTMHSEQVKPSENVLQPDASKVHKKQAKALVSHQRKYLVVKTLAYAYVVNIICIAPVYILWMTGFYYNLQANSASSMFAEAIDLLYLFAAPMDSIMYAVVSTDFRRAYSRIIRCR